MVVNIIDLSSYWSALTDTVLFIWSVVAILIILIILLIFCNGNKNCKHSFMYWLIEGNLFLITLVYSVPVFIC